MKKNNLLTIILLTIALGIGYLIGVQNQSTQDELSTLQEEKQVENNTEEANEDLFAKKQECQKYRDGILDELKEKETETINAIKARGGTEYHSINLEGIYYSSTRNTCISYVIDNTSMIDEQFRSHEIKDILSDEILELIMDHTVYSSGETTYTDPVGRKDIFSESDLQRIIEDYKK